VIGAPSTTRSVEKRERPAGAWLHLYLETRLFLGWNSVAARASSPLPRGFTFYLGTPVFSIPGFL